MATKEEVDSRLREKKKEPSAKEGDFVPPNPITAQHDLVINELETSDGHLGTSLRSVYDSGSPDVFLERLDGRIKQHDREIEHMCNYHYQGFIESVRSLLLVRSEVEKLKTMSEEEVLKMIQSSPNKSCYLDPIPTSLKEIHFTNEGLQESGRSMFSKGEQLVHNRKTQRNIESAMETLSLCLPVLETYGKLKDQMKNKRYYPALKTLEQLEHTYLPRVSKYRFSAPMCETIPKLRDNIKEASMSDLKDFLENIRKHSERIGEVAMKHAAEQHGMDIGLALKKSTPKKRRAPPPPNPFTGEIEGQQKPPANPFEEDDTDSDGVNNNGAETSASFIDIDIEEGLSAQDMVDFSPVYRCLHIYSVLGAKETFESYYRKQRRKQARLALQPPPNMDRGKRLVQSQGTDPAPHETLEGYKKYFHDVIGFFIVEDHILNTTQGLVNRAYIDELWDMALSKIVAVLRTHIGFCTDPTLMLQIKALIMLFCHTLKGYGFTVSQLYDLLLEIRDQYSEILMKKWVEVFKEIFNEDNYTPIQVETVKEFTDITGVYPFMDEALEKAPFPKSFPFSHFVPKVYCQVKEYIYACLKFSEDLHLSYTEQETMIYKFANQFLEDCLKPCFVALLTNHKMLNLLQLIQISINMNYLEHSCSYLEDFIANITGAEKENVKVSKLQGSTMFKDARSEAEEHIYQQINDKIDEFFDLASYDWMLGECEGHPSEYIIDLIAFLQSTFFSFTNLPEKVAQTSCMSACQHIAKRLQDLLVDPEVKSLSMAALTQFNLDLKMCEEFAASNPVPVEDEQTLRMSFLDLRQLMNLFLNWDWTNYVAEFGKDYSRYLRVNPQVCIVVLEKLRESDKRKNNLLTTFKKNERDRKKLVDTLLKQLRQLSSGQVQQG